MPRSVKVAAGRTSHAAAVAAAAGVSVVPEPAEVSRRRRPAAGSAARRPGVCWRTVQTEGAWSPPPAGCGPPALQLLRIWAASGTDGHRRVISAPSRGRRRRDQSRYEPTAVHVPGTWRLWSSLCSPLGDAEPLQRLLPSIVDPQLHPPFRLELQRLSARISRRLRRPGIYRS